MGTENKNTASIGFLAGKYVSGNYSVAFNSLLLTAVYSTSSYISWYDNKIRKEDIKENIKGYLVDCDGYEPGNYVDIDETEKKYIVILKIKAF